MFQIDEASLSRVRRLLLQEGSMEDKKNDDVSDKVWMMKKKSWVRKKYGR